jgi:hypothetical protein
LIDRLFGGTILRSTASLRSVEYCMSFPPAPIIAGINSCDNYPDTEGDCHIRIYDALGLSHRPGKISKIIL